MKILSKSEFLERKTSDTLVVLGSGSSINKMSLQHWEKISSYDSIGFNWFCHHSFGPTFFVIREQANTKYRCIESETKKRLFRDLSKKSFNNTCLIVHDLSKHSKHVYNYAINKHRIKQSGIIVKDIRGKLHYKKLRHDIFEKGVFHGSCTLTNVLHIGLYLQYKKIIFVGIDLRNSFYFWLPKGNTRKNISRKGLSSKSRHPVFRKAIRLIKVVKKHFSVEMVTANPKSGLKQYIPVERLI